MNADTSYLNLVKQILTKGELRSNRTGIKTLSINGAMIRFDMREGFPAITTKKLAFKSVCAELCGFIRGVISAADFRALGTKIWDQNANENQDWLKNPFRKGVDDLGPIYGKQWRNWDACKMDLISKKRLYSNRGWSLELDTEDGYGYYYKKVDQLSDCIDLIKSNPDSRRILFHAWNPAEIEFMALPPCHILYQFHPNPETKVMGLSVYLRSNDVGLGTPFNMASAGLLLACVGHATGYTPGVVSLMIGDAHIYENQLDMLNEQVKREPYPLPSLEILTPIAGNQSEIDWLGALTPDSFSLTNYQHHPPLTAPMAV